MFSKCNLFIFLNLMIVIGNGISENSDIFKTNSSLRNDIFRQQRTWNRNLVTQSFHSTNEPHPWYLSVLKGLSQIIKGYKGNVECLRQTLFHGLDRAIEYDSVKVSDGIYLVKEQNSSSSLLPHGMDKDNFLMALARRIVVLLETHALRVRLGVMKDVVGQARIGHHGYRHAFPLMVGSFMLMAAFFVPMGFQFLAVIGGKALILSQIALLVAMGGTIQRYFGLRGGNYPIGAPAQPAPVGGFIQHEYFLNGEGSHQPWHRVMADEGDQRHQHQLITSTEQLTQQQLAEFMHHKVSPPRS